ncbi:hypothetical protein TYRP_018555 [Tyrophagus putrescentiae]|nr:hypothetical protein TYRP_018555 [Tyrophagus putrescentiae]
MARDGVPEDERNSQLIRRLVLHPRLYPHYGEAVHQRQRERQQRVIAHIVAKHLQVVHQVLLELKSKLQTGVVGPVAVNVVDCYKAITWSIN